MIIEVHYHLMPALPEGAAKQVSAHVLHAAPLHRPKTGFSISRKHRRRFLFP